MVGPGCWSAGFEPASLHLLHPGSLLQSGSARLERAGRLPRAMLGIPVLCSSVPLAFLLLPGDRYVPLHIPCQQQLHPGHPRWRRGDASYRAGVLLRTHTSVL